MSTLGKRKYSGPYAPTPKGRVARATKKLREKRFATVQTVKRLIAYREEEKHFDSLQTAVTVDFSGNSYLISNIAQGTADGQRLGDAIDLKWIEGRIAWTLGTSPNKVRIIILQWHEMCVGGSPNVGSVLENLGTAVTYLQSYVWSNRKAFTVLRDKTYELETGVTTTAIDRFKIKSGFRKKIQYSAGSSTSMQNGIFIIVVSDDGVVTYPTFSHHTRICYSDA